MWQTEQALSCPGCGLPRDEVWVWDSEEKAVKEASVSSHLRLCVACAARDFRVEQTSHQDGSKHGMHPVVERH